MIKDNFEISPILCYAIGDASVHIYPVTTKTGHLGFAKFISNEGDQNWEIPCITEEEYQMLVKKIKDDHRELLFYIERAWENNKTDVNGKIVAYTTPKKHRWPLLK